MRIVVAGASGLIGSELVRSLRDEGHTVSRLVRREPVAADEFSWDPETFGLPSEAVAGADAVIGLGGVGVGDRRWSGQFKQELRDSRIPPTTVLAEAVAEHSIPVFISASATGYYGDTGSAVATEDSPAGKGFLAELVTDWERAATTPTDQKPPSDQTTRVALLRTAPVLSRSGGMLAKLRPLFKLGLGGPIGSGQQYFSWISLPDEIRAITHLLHNDISGPVNLCAPQPVPFAEFTTAFARSVGRPAFFKVPAFAARAVGGEMAEEMILYSQRVVPDVLNNSGFQFRHPDIASALDHARG